MSLNSLALLYHDQGKYAEAEPLYQRALAFAEKVLGPEHPSTAASLNNLAGLYRDQGKYADAEALFARAMGISEKALGPQHPDTADGLNNLANVYLDQGKYAQAEPLFKRMLVIYEKIPSPDHPGAVLGVNKLLGQIYARQGKYADAEPLYRRALGIAEEALGPQHPHVADVLKDYARLLRETGRNEEGQQMEQRAREIRAGAPQEYGARTGLNSLLSPLESGHYANTLCPCLAALNGGSDEGWLWRMSVGPDGEPLGPGFRPQSRGGQGRYYSGCGQIHARFRDHAGNRSP